MRVCFFCGQSWKMGEKAKCQCYKQVDATISVYCPRKSGRRNLQVCYLCEHITECEAREEAEVNKLLNSERPRPKVRRKR